jgi:hypothetical protein
MVRQPPAKAGGRHRLAANAATPHQEDFVAFNDRPAEPF